MANKFFSKEITLKVSDLTVLLVIAALLMCGVNLATLYGGRDTGKAELLATIETCLEQELSSTSADCEDPNFMLFVTPQAHKVVVYVGDSSAHLRGMTQPKLFGVNSIFKDANNDHPFTGFTTGVFERDGGTLIIEEVSGRFEPDQTYTINDMLIWDTHQNSPLLEPQGMIITRDVDQQFIMPVGASSVLQGDGHQVVIQDISEETQPEYIFGSSRKEGTWGSARGSR